MAKFSGLKHGDIKHKQKIVKSIKRKELFFKTARLVEYLLLVYVFYKVFDLSELVALWTAFSAIM